MEFSKNEVIVLNAIIALFIALITVWIVMNGFLISGILFCVASFLVLILFNLRQASHKKLDVFNVIDMEILKGKAFLWASSLESLQKITLFRIPFQQYGKSKYILCFEFDTTTIKGQGCKGTFDGHGWSYEKYPLKDDFKEVYKHSPPDDFLDEWLITTELEKEFHNYISVVLYGSKNT